MITLQDDVYRDLVGIAKDMEGRDGLKRFFGNRLDAAERMHSVLALIAGPYPDEIKSGSAEIARGVIYREEHPQFPRTDWRTAVRAGATDLGYDAWSVAMLAYGTQDWLCSTSVLALAAQTWVVAQAHLFDETGSRSISPGEMLRIERAYVAGTGAGDLRIIVSRPGGSYDEGVTTVISTRERGGLAPLTRAGVTASTPPRPGDRLAGDWIGDTRYLTVAHRIDDDENAPGTFRVVDQFGIERLCIRCEYRWMLL